MILLTVGTQLPFDRLIGDMDVVAGDMRLEVFGQIGVTTFEPVNFEYSKMLHPVRFDTLCRQAALIVSHAGIGSILMAQKYKKPIIIYPRQARFGEHRNDHQLATCKHVGKYEGVYPATDRAELSALLARDDLVAPDSALIQRRQDAFIGDLRNHLSKVASVRSVI